MIVQMGSQNKCQFDFKAEIKIVSFEQKDFFKRISHWRFAMQFSVYISNFILNIDISAFPKLTVEIM